MSCDGRTVMRRFGFFPLLVALLTIWPAHAPAQFYYFGRNKVQYTDFDWHVLKTEHFDIYYYPEMKDLAERGAFFAEESYRSLEKKFNHTLSQRVPLILYSSHLHFEQTNTVGGFIPEGIGGFFEFMKGRVVIPFDGSIAAFRHVICHELVHVFMHSKVTRVMSDHRQIQETYPPLWFTEGLAEYWSTDWDMQAEMVMRDAVLNESVVGLDDMDRIYGTFIMYKEGQNALMHLASQYGEEKVLLLLENLWKGANFSDVFRATIGKDYKEFDRTWLYALKKQYYPLLQHEDAPSQVTSTLVGRGFNFKPAVFENDTTHDVYFMSNRTGYTGIYRRSLNDPRREETGESVLEGEQSNELEVFHPYRNRIDISPRGVIAFVTKSGENDALHLYDISSGEMAPARHFRSLVAIGSVSWSPDGRRLAFSAIDKSGNHDLYVLDLETEYLQRLTDDFYDDRDPAWSPRGDRIAFASDRSPSGDRGTYNLFLYDLSTGGIEYLTCDEANHLSPAWSHDGSMLAFTADRGGVQNIWVMPMADSALGGRFAARSAMVEVTHFVTSAFDPAWTRAGGLVFTAFEKLSFQIRMIPDLRAILDTASTVLPVDVTDRDRPWEPKVISGSQQSVRRYRYEGEYTLDFAQGAISTSPVFGTTGGAYFAISDLLGNDIYSFLIFNSAQVQSEILSSWNVAISRISLRQRTSYAYGIYHFAGRRYDLTSREEFYWERIFGGYLTLSYPLSKFQRIETTVSLSSSARELDTEFEQRKSMLLSNELSFVHDNSLWLPTGPIDGRRLLASLAYTTDIQYSNVNYFTGIFDFRNYLRLGTRTALASRFWLFYNHGKESRRFFMGGSWDLRGYPRWSIRGEKLWLVSQELRFPVVTQLVLGFPFGGIGLGEIRGAAFVDAGSAWDRSYGETLGSAGVGLRWNFGGVIVFRYDTGKLITGNFRRLSPSWFHQFFFGWDF
jgi:hypothetical protein